MREFLGLGKNDAWAVMSQSADDPHPPILIFESREVAELYRHEIAGDDWKVYEIDNTEIQELAEDSGNRVMLCTQVGEGRIKKIEIDVEQSFSRHIELN